jgi:glutathione S-transferase
MKLFHALASPFVRKVMIAAIERGIDGQIEFLPAAAHPIDRDRSIVARNPSGKVPTLLLDDGTALYDSRVIVEYLDSLPGGPNLIPAAGRERWEALVLQSLADEMTDAAILVRYETFVRPEDLRWESWINGQMDKFTTTCDELENRWMDKLAGPLTIGTVAVACALGYLDFRFPNYDWRSRRPRLNAWYAGFSQRPSMQRTKPPV